jgi:hypothetical protein
MITSIEIANEICVEHHSVMDNIRKLIKSNSILSVNYKKRESAFVLSSYINCNGIEFPMYIVSAEGVLLLSNLYSCGVKNKLIVMIWEHANDKIKEKTNEQ